MASEELVVFLRAQIGEFQSKMKTAQGDVEDLSKKGASGFDKLAAVGKAALIGVAGAAIGIGTIAVKNALEAEQAHARLVNAITNTGNAYKTYGGQVDATSQRLAKFGFNHSEVESSLANLVRATKSPAVALGQMGLAADIARGRNIDLASATNILVKVATGHVGLLGRLGIATKDATGHTISQAEALKRLSQLYGGAAQANAKTFAGKTQALKAQLHNLTQELGEKLIPVLATLAVAALKVISFFEKHKALAIGLGVAIGTVLLAAIGAYTIAMIQAAVATIAATAPILAIVAAIALVVAGIVLLVTHWSQVWDAIKAATLAAWNFLKDFFTNLPGNIVHALASLAGLLGGVFSNALQWVAKNLPNYAKQLAEWWVALPIIIVGWLGELAGQLALKFASALIDLAKKLPGFALAVAAWFLQLPSMLANFLIPLGLTLGAKFLSALVGLAKALPGFAKDLIQWFTDLPSNIVKWIGDVGNVLYDIGKKIIGGLIHGITDAIGGIKDAVGGIASKIVSWKGPPAYDSTLLIDNGKRIMAGLRAGIAQGLPAIKAELDNVTAQIASPTAASVPLSTPSRSTVPVVVNIAVNNPTGNGEEIVYSAARALSKGQGRTAMLKALGLK